MFGSTIGGGFDDCLGDESSADTRDLMSTNRARLAKAARVGGCRLRHAPSDYLDAPGHKALTRTEPQSVDDPPSTYKTTHIDLHSPSQTSAQQ